MSNEGGLKAKYNVTKVDTGELVHECFVLRPQKDKVARRALETYANLTDNRELASDIYRWLDRIEG